MDNIERGLFRIDIVLWIGMVIFTLWFFGFNGGSLVTCVLGLPLVFLVNHLILRWIIDGFRGQGDTQLSRQLASQEKTLARHERKLDAVLKHLDIDLGQFWRK